MALIQTQTRRGFMGGIAAAGAAGLIRAPRAEAADGPLETTTVRFQKPGSLCVPSLYIAEQRLPRGRFHRNPLYRPTVPRCNRARPSTARSIFCRPMPISASGRLMPVNR